MPPLPDRVLPLQGATNFRDLGGYEGDGRRSVRWRQVFRSDHLNALTPADHALLAGLGVAHAIDFRGGEESAAHPYDVPGVRRLALAIEPSVVQRMDALAAEGRPRDTAMAIDAMQDLYHRLVDHQHGVYARFFAHLLADDAPVVFHCTAGKDRTGMAAALLLLALGVDREAVMHDFLLTNTHYRRPAAVNGSTLPPEVTDVLWSVQESFLQAGLDRIDQSHGGIDRYLAERIGLGAAERAALRARLLE